MAKRGLRARLTAASVWANSRTGGPEGFSLCARFWDDRLNGKPFATVIVAALDLAFSPWEQDHCRPAWLRRPTPFNSWGTFLLLYTSDAADDMQAVNLRAPRPTRHR